MQDKINRTLKLMEEFRRELNDLVAEKGTFNDSEVIIASKMLDAVLNEYERLLRQKEKRIKEGFYNGEDED